MAESPGDTKQFAAYGIDLVDAVDAALPVWIRHQVERRLAAAERAGLIPRPGPGPGPDEAREVAETPEAGPGAEAALARELAEVTARARADIVGELTDLLARDIDEQWTNPLSILRRAARYPTEILARRRVPAVDRDRHAARLHPDDVYDLTPGAFAEFGPEVQECGIRWGAAKAHLHLTRRKGS